MIPPNATSKPARVLFLADGGPEVGGGHVLRCLTLAHAVAARGAACAFVAQPGAAAILRTFDAGGAKHLPATTDEPRPLALEAEAIAGGWEADVVVVDHYRLTAAQETRLRGGRRRIASIDDLPGRRHDCDLLIDPTLGVTADSRRGVAPASSAVLAGPAYALVRPAYAEARPAALARRKAADEPRRVLLSLGLTDLRGVTGVVLHILGSALDGLTIDVALGSGAPSLSWLKHRAQEDPLFNLHVDSLDMPRLMAEADIGIGAGGSSVWERACLGLPSLNLVLADNQRPMADELGRRGAALTVETRDRAFAERLLAAFGRLRDEPGLRASLSETSAGLCDGLGAARVAAAVTDLVV